MTDKRRLPAGQRGCNAERIQYHVSAPGRIAAALFPLPGCIPGFGQSGPAVLDVFGRTLNQAGIKLVDWDGYMANPAIKLVVAPPADAACPASAVLRANNQRLYLDMPSAVGINGPGKTVQSSSVSSRATVCLGNAPDRDSANGNDQLTIDFTDANRKVTTLNVPIHEIDQDQQTANPAYTIHLDCSQDRTAAV